MARIVKVISNRLFALAQRVWPFSLAVCASIMIAPALVQAHGMGMEEVGPPIVTSGLVGFVCYWLVMLWPSGKRKSGPNVGVSGQNRDIPRIKRKPRLRVIETNPQLHSEQTSQRRAADG